MRGALGSSSARSPARLVCSDRASAGLTRRPGRRSKTRWSPTVENTRFLWPMPPSSPSSWIVSSTASMLWAGSPMPMNTTFFTGRRARASTTWARISALVSWRSRPSRPVMQKVQPTAQPTWLDTHRPSRGSSTLSTVWPSASSTSRRAEPSSPGCSERTRASPASSAVSAGRASTTALGSAGPRRVGPASRGRACSQARSMRCTCTGLAPRSARRWRRVSMRMRGRILAFARAPGIADVARGGARHARSQNLPCRAARLTLIYGGARFGQYPPARQGESR